MSMLNLSIDREFRYIIQWFNEWSELQRDDFVPVLVECLQKDSPEVYMNGVTQEVAQADLADKPMSLFQCRIKLFRQWSPKWSQELRHKLKDKIIEIDTKVGDKIIDELKENNIIAPQINVPDVVIVAAPASGDENSEINGATDLQTVPTQNTETTPDEPNLAEDDTIVVNEPILVAATEVVVANIEDVLPDKPVPVVTEATVAAAEAAPTSATEQTDIVVVVAVAAAPAVATGAQTIAINTEVPLVA